MLRVLAAITCALGGAALGYGLDSLPIEIGFKAQIFIILGVALVASGTVGLVRGLDDA